MGEASEKFEQVSRVEEIIVIIIFCKELINVILGFG